MRTQNFNNWPDRKDFLEEFKDLLSRYERPANQILLDEADAISYLKVSKRCLAKWRSAGTIPAHKLGGKIYYIQSELIDAVRKESEHKNRNPRL